MQYHLTAGQILRLLGFGSQENRQSFEAMKQKLGLPLPQAYQEFMEVAWDCPLLATGDLWVGQMIPSQMDPCPLYHRLEPADRAQICDYLEIGSDYGAGIVTYGIPMEQLTQQDPPVYLQHEADPVTQWRLAYDRLSDFLLENLLNALTLVAYETAEEALEEQGWQYTDYTMDYLETHAGEAEDDDIEQDAAVTEAALVRLGIDPDQINWRTSIYEGRTFCCYDEQNETFYTGLWEGNEENSLYSISRAEEE